MNKREPTLFPKSTLISFAVVALGALALAFPGQRLFQQLRNKPTDIATLAYTRAAFNREPGNIELRLRLVQQLVETGQAAEAEELLSPLIVLRRPQLTVSELNLKLKCRRYFDSQNSEEKAQLKHQIHKEFQRIVPQLSNIAKLEELAELTTQLGEQLLAAEIYRRIVELQEQSAPPHTQHSGLHWLGISSAQAETSSKPKQFYIEKQLQALLAANTGPEALQWAEYYVKQNMQNAAILHIAIEIAEFQNDQIRARDWGRKLLNLETQTHGTTASIPPCQTDAHGEKLLWACRSKNTHTPNISLPSLAFINFVKHLRDNNSPLQKQFQKELAANELDNSLAWIQEQLRSHPHSEDYLRFASLLAKSQGKATLARDFNAQLLQLKPNDTALLQEQINHELSIPDLQRALIYAQQWLALAPDDAQARDKTAEIALWAGNPEISLEHLLWLYQRSQNPEQLKKITALATALFKHELLADLFTQIGTRRPLTEAEVNSWFDALQKSGRADAGKAALKSYVAQWPKHQSAWQLLLKTQEYLGELEDALASSQQFAQHFGSTTELKLLQANYLLKLGRIQDAWHLLSQTAKTTPATDLKFWDKFAATAFLMGAERDMLMAFQHNAKVGQNNPTLNYYLLTLLRQNEDSQQYTKFALQIFDVTKELSTLLDLITFKIQHNEWDAAKQLLADLDKQKPEAERSTHYWLTKAEISGHFGDKQRAQNDIKTALQLDPNSPSTRSLLIWHLLADKNNAALSQLLQESQNLAQQQPLLWEAMAAGYRAIGKPQAAMHWYVKAIKQWPARQSLIMGYADVLQEANQLPMAKQLWRYILSHLNLQDLAAQHVQNPTQSSAYERRYAELVRLYYGNAAGERWFQWLQQHQTPSTEFAEYRISWFLAQQRHDAAHALALAAESQGAVLPPWQRLAIAFTDNDVKSIKTIINTPNHKLSEQDEIAALRATGEESAALAKVTKLLTTKTNEQELDWLRRQTSDLMQQHPKGWAFGAKLFNVSQLDIFNDYVDVTWSMDKHNFLVNYQDMFYSASDATLHVQPTMRHEQLLNVEWRYRAQHYQSLLRTGVSFRDDNDYLKLEGNFNYFLSPGWNALIEAGFNVPSAESAVFRLAGLTDKLELRLAGELTKREYFSLNLQSKRFKTRSNDNIGYGFGGGFEVGYRLFFERPETVIAFYGNWKHANLDADIHEDWRSIVDANTTMHNILNASYSELGLDLRLKEGDIRPFGYTDRSLRYFVEVGAFYSEPMQSLGSKVYGGIGTRLFENDEISLLGQYSSVQGTAQSIPSAALELRYSKRFN